MTPKFAKILCPVDLDANAATALDHAALLARQSAGEVVVLHVIATRPGLEEDPTFAELRKPNEDEVRVKLGELARRRLRDVIHEVRVEAGNPSAVIVDVARRLPADLVVIATHRSGFSRSALGSVAERVVHGAQYPVLIVKNAKSDRFSVAQWMTVNPVTVEPDAPLPVARRLMHEGNFRTLPVVSRGQLVGIITDRDLRIALERSEKLTVEQAMTWDLFTVTADTSIFDASRLLAERKVGALPVVEKGQLIGVISTEDLLKAFVEVR